MNLPFFDGRKLYYFYNFVPNSIALKVFLDGLVVTFPYHKVRINRDFGNGYSF